MFGRFLSPDNFIQDLFNIVNPDKRGFVRAQAFNRFGYAWNNPLKYTDPSGEFFWVAVAIGALMGGFNAAVTGGNLGDIIAGALIGGAAAAIGAGVANLVAGGTFVGNAALTATGFLNGATTGGAGGFARGFFGGTVNAWANGASLEGGLKSGMYTGIIGGLTGGLVGGISGGIRAAKKGLRFIDGANVESVTANPNYDVPLLSQSDRASCSPTCGASIDQSLGGDLTEEKLRNLIPGDWTGKGIADAEFWEEFSNISGHNYQGMSASSIDPQTLFNQVRGGGANNFRLAFSTRNHSVVFQSITHKTITKLNGNVINRYIIRAMDPAHGAYRSYNYSQFINAFRIW